MATRRVLVATVCFIYIYFDTDAVEHQPNIPPQESQEAPVWHSAFAKSAGMAFRCVLAQFKYCCLFNYVVTGADTCSEKETIQQLCAKNVAQK